METFCVYKTLEDYDLAHDYYECKATDFSMSLIDATVNKWWIQVFANAAPKPKKITLYQLQKCGISVKVEKTDSGIALFLEQEGKRITIKAIVYLTT